MTIRTQYAVHWLAVLLLSVAGRASAAEAEAPTEEPAIQELLAGLKADVAAFDAVDPSQPQALTARIDYARLLHESGAADCLPEVEQAAAVLAPVLAAGPDATVAWPDGPGDALSLMQTILNTRGQCAEDEAGFRSAFEEAIATGQRAVEALRANWDFEEMAIAQFNIAFARHELGDGDGALRDLEQVLAWDQEFGFREELETDYATYLRWRADGAEPDPDDVDQFVNSFNQTKARFAFDWKPHRARWSTEATRANLKDGRYGEVTTRYETKVDARREGEDWVLTTVLDALPSVQAAGALAASDVEKLQGLISGLTAVLPETLVARDGSFKGLRNVEQFRASMLGELKRLIAETPGKVQKPEDVERMLDTMLTAELLTTLAAGQWDIAVAAWIDGEFDHGDWYSATFEEPLPGFTDKPLKKTMTFKVSRWLPCAPGRQPTCVEVLARIEPEPDAMKAALSEFIGRILPEPGRREMEVAMKSISFEFDVRYRIVTEPDTLMPWSVEERKYVYVSSIEGGRRSVQARRDRTLEVASYPN